MLIKAGLNDLVEQMRALQLNGSQVMAFLDQFSAKNCQHNQRSIKISILC